MNGLTLVHGLSQEHKTLAYDEPDVDIVKHWGGVGSNDAAQVAPTLSIGQSLIVRRNTLYIVLV